jgi:hypothetical protein
MDEKMTGKERIYQLFNEGKAISSPEVKALGLKASTRYSYHTMWKKAGKPASALGTASPAREAGKQEIKSPARGKTALIEGETIKAISEVAEKKSKEKDEKSREMDEPEEKSEEKSREAEDESKGEKDDMRKVPSSIVGEGLTATVHISVKTLALYQIAAQMQGDGLSLGDFLDACVEDTFRGRSKDLGIINLGGSK